MELIYASFSIKRLLYLIFVTFTALSLHYLSGHSQSYWLVWSALFLSLMTYGDTFSQRTLAIGITGVAMILSVFFAGCMSIFLPLLAGYLFLTIATGVFLAQRYPGYFFSLFLISLFAIIASVFPSSALDNLFRIMYIGIGLVVAIIFQILFWPHFIRNEAQSLMIISLRNLKLLSREIFSCFLQLEYADNIYLFERRLHQQRSRFMQCLRQLRAALSYQKTKQKKEIVTKLEILYDILLDCAQLRRRVSDYTTFSVCVSELAAIAAELDSVFSQLIISIKRKKQSINTARLVDKIQQLEESYQNVLQVVAREPLVFLLFISSLKALSEVMQEFYEDKNK